MLHTDSIYGSISSSLQSGPLRLPQVSIHSLCKKNKQDRCRCQIYFSSACTIKGQLQSEGTQTKQEPTWEGDKPTRAALNHLPARLPGSGAPSPMSHCVRFLWIFFFTEILKVKATTDACSQSLWSRSCVFGRRKNGFHELVFVWASPLELPPRPPGTC